MILAKRPQLTGEQRHQLGALQAAYRNARQLTQHKRVSSDQRRAAWRLMRDCEQALAAFWREAGRHA